MVKNWPHTDDVLRYQQAQEEALKKNFRVVGNVELTEVNNFRQHLFHVKHQGGKDIVELNISHPFAQAISKEEYLDHLLRKLEIFLRGFLLPTHAQGVFY